MNNTFQPEKLNLWDRIFNRYRKVIVEEGAHTWFLIHPHTGQPVQNSEYKRIFVKYKIIDRITGSEKIEIKYL